MNCTLNLAELGEKRIFPLDGNFSGKNPGGEEISFTNYYMQENGKPFFGISGEIHYSRLDEQSWEDELIKMKMGGINVVATYLFWIHHEEEEGVFDFSGRRNLRRFIELCQKHGFYVILRVGPFDHGECRNGGIPDWMYGKPFEVRHLNDGFLFYVRRLYTKIAEQISGLFYQDNGPIIGIQIDNEYMHSSAPWESTTGVANEWVYGGSQGNAYMEGLRDLAADCGLRPVFYTCTGWGGAATPDSMLPLWGGYAFRPWMFYSNPGGTHPATDEFVYQDFHNNNVTCDYDFKPTYRPEDRPYSCCEMGGGMICAYNYRFQMAYKSVDAMANIKIASGCNFLGYYMYHGGRNPLGRHGGYLNESQAPKISYDFQAPMGSYGQIRESYQRLKSTHYMLRSFGEGLCRMQTVLPEGASQICPEDMGPLRYAVRTDGKRGFLFVNNFQDHVAVPARSGDSVTLQLADEALTFDFSIGAEENAILPFHLDLDGIELVQATAQPVTRAAAGDEVAYVFLAPDGMRASFRFAPGTQVNGQDTGVYTCAENLEAESFQVAVGGLRRTILVLSRDLSNRMYTLEDGTLIFTDGVILEDERGLRLETECADNILCTWPASLLEGRARNLGTVGPLGRYQLAVQEKIIEPRVEHTMGCRYTISMPGNFMEGIKDARLQLNYRGDIGHVFLNDRLIDDNFCNRAVFELGLKTYARELEQKPMVMVIVPSKSGVKINVASTMAGRSEEVAESTGVLDSVAVKPIYEITLR